MARPLYPLGLASGLGFGKSTPGLQEVQAGLIRTVPAAGTPHGTHRGGRSTVPSRKYLVQQLQRAGQHLVATMEGERNAYDAANEEHGEHNG